MSGNNASALMDPLPVVLYNNDPLFICPAPENMEECTFMFNTDFICNNPTMVFPSNYYPSQDGDQEISLKMKMMPIIYKNQPKDQPEFIDVNSLTSCLEEAKMVSPKDDENDVIFVGEFQKEPVASSSTAIRRNPTRRARTIERRHLQKEHLLEEDFAFLDQIDEDCLVQVKAKQPQPKSLTSITEPKDSSGLYFKEWPSNSYERPEYCEEGGKIEPFDYSIRNNIGNKQVKKRSFSCLETGPKEKPKPKKKFVFRKRRSKVKKPVDKIAVDQSLTSLVRTTSDLLNDFLQKEKLAGCDKLMQNQAMLLGVLNQSLSHQSLGHS